MLMSNLVLLGVVFAKWAEPYITQNRGAEQDPYELRDNQRSTEYYRDGRYLQINQFSNPSIHPSIHRYFLL